ncbi:hypothetical protein AcW2_001286 [Taiwanofungus camphoratus]|nr:hypothetical protein AcW2_001286 [Antrodia cinnamomea]
MQSMASALEGMSIAQLAELMFARVQGEAALMSTESLENLHRAISSSLIAIQGVRNSRRPINSLPPEILGMIFHHVPGPYFMPGEEDFQFQIWEPAMLDPYALIYVTHVCRHWRNVAFETPALWSTIGDIHHEAQKAWFQRSKLTPLNVALTDPLNRCMRTLCRSAGSRVRELHWATFVRHTNPSLKFRASNLELLTLSYEGKAAREDSNAAQGVSDPPVLFRGHTPLLRRLTIHALPWIPVNHFPQLTQLCLCKVNISKLKSRILDMLSACPKLVDLVLIGLLDPTDDLAEVEPDDCIVSFNHLRRLVVGDAPTSRRTSGSILPYLRLNTGTAVRVLNGFEWSRRHCRQLVQIPIIKNLTRLCYSEVSSCPVVTAVGSSSGIRFDLPWISSGSHGLREILSFSQIQELWITGRHTRYYNPNTLLDSAPALKALTIYETSLSCFVGALYGGRCLKLAEVTILFDGLGTTTSVLEELAQRKERLCIKHLTIGYLPKYKGERVTRTDQDIHFDSVEYKHLTETPRMAVPDVCATEAYLFWPSWVNG